MSGTWVRHSAGMAAIGAALCALTAPQAALAGIVVAASGPSAKDYPAGRKLDDAARINLRAGDAVTVLDARGTRVLRGPATVTVGSTGGPTRTSAFAALTRKPGSTRVRTGAVRGDTGAGKVIRPNLWYLDATQPGPMCVVGGVPLEVWRPHTGTPASYAIASADGRTQTTVSFDGAAMLGDWDTARAPIADGTSYWIRTPGSAQPSQVTFEVLPSLPATPEDLAAALIANGCAAQLAVLADTLALPSG